LQIDFFNNNFGTLYVCNTVHPLNYTSVCVKPTVDYSEYIPHVAQGLLFRLLI